MLITALFTIAKTQKQPKCKYPLKKDWIKKSNTYIYVCVCVCMCVRERETETERSRKSSITTIMHNP